MNPNQPQQNFGPMPPPQNFGPPPQYPGPQGPPPMAPMGNMPQQNFGPMPPQGPPMGYGPQGPMGPMPYGPMSQPNDGLGIAGMCLGIAGLLFVWIPYISWFSIAFAIAGLIMSIVSRKRSRSGPALAGIICSAIALGIWVVLIFLVTILFGMFWGAVSSSPALYW